MVRLRDSFMHIGRVARRGCLPTDLSTKHDPPPHEDARRGFTADYAAGIADGDINTEGGEAQRLTEVNLKSWREACSTDGRLRGEAFVVCRGTWQGDAEMRRSGGRGGMCPQILRISRIIEGVW